MAKRRKKRKKPREHWRRIKTRRGYKKILINKGVRPKQKIKRRSRKNTEDKKKESIRWLERYSFENMAKREKREREEEKREKERERRERKKRRRELDKLRRVVAVEIDGILYPASLPYAKKRKKDVTREILESIGYED